MYNLKRVYIQKKCSYFDLDVCLVKFGYRPPVHIYLRSRHFSRIPGKDFFIVA